MAAAGNNTLSVRKKDLVNQRDIGVGFSKLQFAHKASAGETGIDLTALSTPIEMSGVGFVQATSTEIAAAKLLFHRKNLTIISSEKGVLQDYLSYQVTTSTRINFQGFTASEGEIFVGIVDDEPVTHLTIVDASPVVKTGEIAAGTDEINTGQFFTVNKFSSEQVGDVLVFVGSTQLFRNVGNATAAPGEDGDYQEVDSGNGQGLIIKLNEIDNAVARPFLVVSNGLVVNRPSNSRDATIETIATTVDNMVPVLADAAGVPEAQFQGQPNSPDLAAFGNRVFALERYRLVANTDSLGDRTGISSVDLVMFDNTAGAGTFLLPSSPTRGQVVELWDFAGNFATFNLTVDRNGSLIEGSTSSFIANQNDDRLRFVYSDSTRGWLVGSMG